MFECQIVLFFGYFCPCHDFEFNSEGRKDNSVFGRAGHGIFIN